MPNFDDREKLASQIESEIEVGDRDVVIVESEKGSRERRSPLSFLPVLLGVIFLVANLVIFLRAPAIFIARNSMGTISLMLLIASVATCLVLIVYGLAAGREDIAGEGRGRYLRIVAVPLVLGLVALLFTLWSLQVNKTSGERSLQLNKPCIEVYEKAAAIAKDNPNFRMLASDRDEVRCKVNAALGR